jgi:tetratricopeptide (TPR) repeat protein
MLQNLSPSQKKLIVCLLLFLATLAVFWQVKNHDFINLDDEQYVTQNPNVRAGLTFKGVAWSFTTAYADFWHPLTWLSHMLDWQLFGTWAGGHHLTSLILHAANAVLLFFALMALTGAFWQSAFVAALFSLHPLHVESVVWVAERKDVLSTFFFLLALAAYARYARSPGWKNGLAVLIPFLFSLMAKPTYVTLPLILLLLDYWPLKRMEAQTQGQEPNPKQKKKQTHREGKTEPDRKAILLNLIKEKIPLLMASLLFGIMAIFVQSRSESSAFTDWPFWVRTANALISNVTYLWMTFWPAGLAPFYPHPGMAVSLLKALLAGAMMIAVSVIAIRYARRFPYLTVGWFWYLITLAPVCGLIQVGKHSMADRYTYIPLVGIFILLTWGAVDLAKKLGLQKNILAAAAGTVLAALVAVTWVQVSYWQNSVILFEHALAVTSGNYLAHTNLGVALNRNGKGEEAASHYLEAIRINPNFSSTQFNLANYYAARGNKEEAYRHYQEAIRIRPDYANAHSNLGVLLASQRSFEEAAAQYEKALRIEPANAGFHYNYGVALANLGRLPEAAGQFRDALALRANYAEAHNDLGKVLMMEGKTAEAASHFREALWIRPNFTEARRNLDIVLESQKQQGRRR